MKTLVPPIKCQGIKTKLVPAIKRITPPVISGRWIEPFCGSCVVALNLRPQRALLSDSNQHLVTFYQSIQDGSVTPHLVKEFLQQEGHTLRQKGRDYYYEIRTRFNAHPTPLDFLFLNRACFNGVMRFNSRGEFNVPFGNKPDRFRQAYITKIVNQIKAFKEVLGSHEWTFQVADFRTSLADAEEDDFIYADPPYSGRHTDYYNVWADNDEADLVHILQQSRSRFILSTWHHSQYRHNPSIDIHWNAYSIKTSAHYYHVGSTEDLRSAMTEALIANYELPNDPAPSQPSANQLNLF